MLEFVFDLGGGEAVRGAGLDHGVVMDEASDEDFCGGCAILAPRRSHVALDDGARFDVGGVR